MANLIVDLDCEFTASKLIWLDEGRSVPLKPAGLKKMIQDSSTEDFGFVVVFAEDDFSPRFSIDFINKGQKKTSVFECDLDFDKALARVRLKGSFKSNKLRSGVKEIMQNEFSGKPIYLEGIIFKGGKWKGFEGYVDGQDGENYSKAMKINSWSVN